MEPWISASNPGRQRLLSVACVAVGVLLMLASRKAGMAGTNGTAGFALGALLTAVGGFGALFSGRQTIAIDPRRRAIFIEESRPLGSARRVILFADVADVRIGYFGRRSAGVRFYYLDLRLRHGGTRTLFAPGRFYEGGSDRATVEGWKDRLQQMLLQAGAAYGGGVERG